MPRWILSVTIIFFILLLFLEFDIIPNRKFNFKCQDPKISHSRKSDTISGKQLLIGTFLGPLVVITLIEIINERSIQNLNKGIIWTHYKRCLLEATFVIVITEFLKTVIQEPRPHFIESCKPDTNEACEKGSYIFEFKCTNTHLSSYSQADLTRSFPSGHASLSLFIALHCSYLVLIRLQSGCRQSFFKALLLITCFGWSFICSLSRITDKRHHWWDVVAGATVGMCSFFLFNRLQQTQRK